MDKKDKNSKWLFIVPISGLKLTSALNSEIKIGNVIFITKNRLPKIRKRLGVPVRISELGEFGLNRPKGFKERIDGFFEYSTTYAVCNFSGTPDEKRTQNIRLIEDAINLMSFSNLGYSTRKFHTKIEIKRSKSLMHYRTIAIDKINKRFSLNLKSLHPVPNELNEDWVEFHKSFFFLKFQKIINGELKINSKWRNTLIAVGRIVGDSLNSHNIPDAFLKNVIALEMLLVKQGEKIEEKLIERSSYFLDWSEHWKKDEIENNIKEIYSKRCDYVHDGKTAHIDKEDLIFTDDLLFNLLNNIVVHLDKISSKGKLIEFSDYYICEKKLGVKSKYQFGKFQFVRKSYSKIELDDL